MRNIQRGLCIDGKEVKGCESETKHVFSSFPEVLTFNLNWDGEPLPLDIFRIMISIPLKFKSHETELFKHK